jgi:hypothetical protein
MIQHPQTFRGSALLAAIALCFMVTTGGCAPSRGKITGSTGTGVKLTGDNYRVIKAGARGEDSGFALFGIIPFASPSYADAKAELYDSVGEPLKGRAVALANQTEDRSTIYLILFSLPKITLTADVIEFTGPAPDSDED